MFVVAVASASDAVAVAVAVVVAVVAAVIILLFIIFPSLFSLSPHSLSFLSHSPQKRVILEKNLDLHALCVSLISFFLSQTNRISVFLVQSSEFEVCFCVGAGVLSALLLLSNLLA